MMQLTGQQEERLAVALREETEVFDLLRHVEATERAYYGALAGLADESHLWVRERDIPIGPDSPTGLRRRMRLLFLLARASFYALALRAGGRPGAWEYLWPFCAEHELSLSQGVEALFALVDCDRAGKRRCLDGGFLPKGTQPQPYFPALAGLVGAAQVDGAWQRVTG